MRTIPLLVALALAGAALAIAPSASAIPACTAGEPGCEDKLVCVGGSRADLCVRNPFVVCVTEPCEPQWP